MGGSARAERTFEDEDFDRDEQFEYLDVNNNGRIEPREWHSDVAASFWARSRGAVADAGMVRLLDSGV